MLAIRERRSLLEPSARLLDVALVVSVAVVAAQLVPLPSSVRLGLAPASGTLEQALYLDAPTRTEAPRPLSFDAAATRLALARAALYVLVFWSARAVFSRGGLRTVVRTIAWFGLALSVIAIVQHALSPTRLYGLWPPLSRASMPAPYGPFINRNDLATWLIIALPLTAGYVLARIEAARASRSIESAVDARTIWLGAALCLMVAALFASTSRSGLAGGAAGCLCLLAVSRPRLRPGRRLAAVISIAAIVALAGAYTNLPALLARVEDAFETDLAGRAAIWSETTAIVRDFWVSGVGVGAFARAMMVYQQSSREIFFNHAHNEYLQLLTEGGLLLAVPVAVALLSGFWLTGRALSADRRSMFFMRAGAAGGLVAACVQAIWDTGIRLPANGVLFAIAAAVAMHRRGTGRSGEL
jgi:O-antigen ligase